MIKARWFLGWFGFYEHLRGCPRSGLAISLRGTLVWGAGLTALTWLGAATLLHVAWDRQPANPLTWEDAVLYPFRRSEIRSRRGQAIISQGIKLWRENKFADAASLLRQGLVRFPEDRRARLILARFQVLTRQWPAALATLEAGLGAGYPGRDYAQALLATAELGEDYATAARLCARLRACRSPAPAFLEERWLSERQFAALLAAGQAAAALALAESEPPGETVTERRIVALLALHRADDAATFLAQQHHQPRPNLELLARLEARVFREAGRLSEMERALATLRALSPAHPAPLVYGIVQRALAREHEAAARVFDDYLFRFGGSVENLLLLAQPLAEIGDVALLERCAAAAAERGQGPQPFDALRLSAALHQGAWSKAAAALARVAATPAPPAGTYAALQRQWLHQLLDAAHSPAVAAQDSLLQTLRFHPWDARTYRTTVAVLRRADRLATAHRAATEMAAAFPASTWAQAQREELALADAAQKPAAPGAPAPRLWTLPVGDAFFATLGRHLDERQWTDAAELIRQARAFDPSPLWLARRDDELRFASLRVSHATGATAEMLATARLYLNGDLARARRVLALARDLDREGDRTAAVALGTEVQRKNPTFTLAAEQLAAWRPPPTPGTE